MSSGKIREDDASGPMRSDPVAEGAAVCCLKPFAYATDETPTSITALILLSGPSWPRVYLQDTSLDSALHERVSKATNSLAD